jgi:membrane-bound lytic murein transglycosylase B
MYLRLAVDGDGDGDRDIWHNRADTLSSIANYFRDAGWRPAALGRARLPETFNRADVTTRLVAPSCPRVHARHSRWLTVAEWRMRGA